MVALLGACLLAAQNQHPNSTGEQANPAAAAPAAPPFVTCPAGSPLGAVDLRVESGGLRLPFRTINHLTEGDTLQYAPIARGKAKRPGEVALVLVPDKREKGQEDILVTDPKPADRAEEWKIDRTISVAALVYGPGGLNRRKVAKFLSRDEVLVAQLADYADKTDQAEKLVTTLSDKESSSESVNAALNGFASQYGFAVQIDRAAPPAAQAATVFAAMNPQLAAYDPLANNSTAQAAGQTASLATMAGTLFFGSPIGLAAGGTAMLLDLRAIAFPDTQFRAAFAQPVDGTPTGVNLCGQQAALPPHTRAAYIWASRIPNIAAPSIQIGDADYLPNRQKAPLPVSVPDPGWKYLDRAHDWTLVANDKKTSVKVVKLGNQKALELDLTKANVPPGDYKLTGLWDWTPLQATGTVHVAPLSDFKTAHLDPASQDRLLAKAGKTTVTVRGSDFEFTSKVQMQKLNDEFATPADVRFLLPKGLRKGPQDHMDLQLDTSDLDPGPYKLLISQQDGNSHAVKFKILPSPPEISNLPILINQGAATQHFVLKGERLELLSRLEAPGAVFKLSPSGDDQTERSLTVELKSSPKPGTTMPVRAYVEDRSEPLAFDDALEITGPRPLIASSKLSLPAGMEIAVHADEFPAGTTLNAVLDVKNIGRLSTLRLGCADGVGQASTLRIGEQTGNWSLQKLSPDQLFLAFDTSSLPAGCSLEASIENGRDGGSPPFTLAHVLRMPGIDSFTVSEGPPENGARQYTLTGQNLEMLARLGWDGSKGLEIAGLPAPLPGPGLKQSIQVSLPDPPAAGAPLYVWLRGDEKGRVTTIKAPALPAPPPPPVAPTTTAVESAPSPSMVGQAVTFVAKVTPATATGTVTFMEGQIALGTATLSSGQGTYTTSSLPAGSLWISAVYSGDTRDSGSASPVLIQTVRKATTAVTLDFTPNPAAPGQEVIFRAVVTAVSSGSVPAGSVTFQAGDTILGTGVLDASGTATFRTATLGAGKFDVKAVYGGSPGSAGSTSTALTLIVQ